MDFFVLLEKENLCFEDLCSKLGLDREVGGAYVKDLQACDYFQVDQHVYALTDKSKAIMTQYQSPKSWTEEMAITYHSLTGLSDILTTGNNTQSKLA
jgi:hypothetical protein